MGGSANTGGIDGGDQEGGAGASGSTVIGGSIGTTGGQGGRPLSGSGGMVATGGGLGTGGVVGSGGLSGSGGNVGSGGILGSGGTVGSGGIVSTGGMVGSGGAGSGGADVQICGFTMPNSAQLPLPNPESYDTSVAGVVIDKVTGLVWERAVSGSTYNQAQGAAYCSANRVDGRSDWRLPSVLELVSILDFGQTDPGGPGLPLADAVAFPGTPKEDFYASTPVAGSPGKAWFVNFQNGNSAVAVATEAKRVRCVRVGTAPAPRCSLSRMRYQIQSSGGAALVADALTGLTWQQSVPAQKMMGSAAQTYCSGLGGGFRLPSVKEVQTLVDLTLRSPNPTIDGDAFPDTPQDFFWTSTRSPDNMSVELFVDFLSGGTSWSGDTSSWNVRCVR